MNKERDIEIMSDLSLNNKNEKRQSAYKSQSDKVCRNYSYHVSHMIGKFFYK